MNYALALNTRTPGILHNVLALLVEPVAVGVSVVLFRRVEEPLRHRLRALRRPRAVPAPEPGPGVAGS